MTYNSHAPHDNAAPPLRDDGGKPATDAATAWLSEHGYDATGRPLSECAGSGDMMTAGRRDTRDVSDWLDPLERRQLAHDFTPFGDLARLDTEIDAKDASLRRFADRHAFFKAVMQPCETVVARKAVAAWGLSLLPRALSEDSRALIAMHVDAALASLGEQFKGRRDKLAAVMHCSPATVHTRIARGRRLWEKVTRDAQAASNETDSKPPMRDAAREATALAEATRALIAATLVEIDVRGEIAAIDKADRKASLNMIPHSLLRVLDVLGLNDDTTRRMLAAMMPDAREHWCADQIRAAVVGTAEERAAARERCGIRYHALVRECVALRAKDSKSVEPQRRAGKAA